MKYMQFSNMKLIFKMLEFTILSYIRFIYLTSFIKICHITPNFVKTVLRWQFFESYL